MPFVTSKDGTSIGYSVVGSGPALLLVDGAMCWRASGPAGPLAEQLKDRFTVYTYDRRGRGESGNTQPYAVEREVEDLQAVIGAAGGSAYVYGISSGAALSLEAANAGSGITKMVLYEAPFIVDHGGYYWLMVSYDYCCKGVNSTYYTVMGRSKAITGPYLGKDGSKLMEGGGTIFLRADLQEQQRFRGPGHAGWLHDANGKDYVVYHAYDKQANGAPTLRIAPVRWGADGWPVADY